MNDEQVRTSLGFTGPQNYQKGECRRAVANHSTAAQVRAFIGDELFFDYHKLAIHRDPLDFLVSQYFYRTQNIKSDQRPLFSDWVTRNQKNVLENYLIAPLIGENRCDTVFAYERLSEDIQTCGFLPSSFYSIFKDLNLKGNVRYDAGRNIKAFYQQHNVGTKVIFDLLQSSGLMPNKNA